MSVMQLLISKDGCRNQASSILAIEQLHPTVSLSSVMIGYVEKLIYTISTVWGQLHCASSVTIDDWFLCTQM